MHTGWGRWDQNAVEGEGRGMNFNGAAQQVDPFELYTRTYKMEDFEFLLKKQIDTLKWEHQCYICIMVLV